MGERWRRWKERHWDERGDVSETEAVVFLGITTPLLRRLSRRLAGFWKAEWRWIIGTLLALAGLTTPI